MVWDLAHWLGQKLNTQNLYFQADDKQCNSRCGTLDELDVSALNECACEAKEGVGSGYGQWVDLELLNVPFLSAMLDPASADFKNVKRIVETTVCV